MGSSCVIFAEVESPWRGSQPPAPAVMDLEPSASSALDSIVPFYLRICSRSLSFSCAPLCPAARPLGINSS